MTRKSPGLVASVGLVTLLCGSSRASAQVSPSLGNAGTYSILAGSAVTNTGATTINGDVGISPGIGPGPHVTGFGTVTFTGGGIVHDADVPAANAQFDRNIAYGALDQACNFTYPGAFKELAGTILVPGVHCATSFHLTGGTLALNGAAGNTWIFKSASDLIVTGGAAARVVSPSCNLWWRVVSSATFDAGSSLTGNILADTSITLAAGASLSGRAFARTAAVTLSGNAIAACVAGIIPPVLPPTITKAFGPANITVGDVSRLTMTLSNPNAAAVTLTATFTDTLPRGVLVAAVPNASTTCGVGAVTAPVGGPTVTLTAGSTIPSGSCVIGVNVIAVAAGSFPNTIPAGALQTSGGTNAAPAAALLTAAPVVPQPPPTPTPTPTPPCATGSDLFIVKSHTGPFVVGTNATYSIALFNQGFASSGAITVVDTLPTGLIFVSATGVGWTCAAVGQLVTCSTTATVPPAAPYANSITLTVTPDANAPPGVTNTAAVGGGGDCDVTNNSTADVTAVAVAVPTLSESAFIMLAILLAAVGAVALRGRASG